MIRAVIYHFIQPVMLFDESIIYFLLLSIWKLFTSWQTRAETLTAVLYPPQKTKFMSCDGMASPLMPYFHL